jgi:hypothetical protein
VSPAIEALIEQVEAAWDIRHPTDGTVASRGHDQRNPRSDHRPSRVAPFGIVRAVDVGETVEDRGELLAEEIRQSGDPRVRYVIHEGRLFSSYNHPNGPPFMWRRYSGASFHTDHVHVSVLPRGDRDPSAWRINLGGTLAALQIIDLQAALNEAGATDHEDKALKEDDIYGPRTASALAKAFKAGTPIDGLTVVGSFTGKVEG